MTVQYTVVIPQLWGHYDREGRWHDGLDYEWGGTLNTDRAALIAATVDELGHDDFCIATVEDGRLAAFGWDMEDFGPDEDGAPMNGHDLVAITRACGLDSAW